MILQEIGYSKHINKRIQERVRNIKSISIPEDFFESDDNKSVIQAFVRKKIELELARRLIFLRDIDFNYNEAIMYKLMIPKIKRNNKLYSIDLVTESDLINETAKEYAGDLYVVVIVGNIGITIMNVASSLSKKELESKIVQYITKGFSTNVRQFPELDFIIDYSNEVKKFPDIEMYSKKTDLGSVSFKKYNEFINYNPNKEKSTHALKEKIEEIDNFIKINSKRIKESELKNIKIKKSVIMKRLEQISSSPYKASENLNKKYSYKKGEKYIHPKFGSGSIMSTKKIGDNFYDIEVNFNDKNPITQQPYSVKKLRVSTKEKAVSN